MSHDVNDHRPRTSGRRDLLGQKANEQPPTHLLSRITRNLNTLAANSLGSFFSGPSPFRYQVEIENERVANTYKSDFCLAHAELENVAPGPCVRNYDNRLWQDDDAHDGNQCFPRSGMIKGCDSLTPTPTRATTPNCNSVQTRFPEVKRLLNKFAGSSTPTVSITVSSDPPASLCGQDMHSQGQGSIQPQFIQPATTTMTFADDPAACSTNVLYSATSDLETPPLTPDSLNEHAFLPPTSSNDSDNDLSPEILIYRDEDPEDNGGLYPPQYTQEIKEGKRPERDICHETLIQDIPSAEPHPNQDGNTSQFIDDKDEWYGLEYTLELSSRERHPSDTQSFSTGEHSKSRESWALIHRGTIHPFFEDEDYHQWKNWHRYLDRQDERRKHKKGFEFKTRAKDLAWFFTDEIRTRDVMYWQKEVYNAVGKEVKERLNYLAAHRPDPYYPRKKHDLGWYLKRSRSIASLRELKPIPFPTKPAIERPIELEGYF